MGNISKYGNLYDRNGNLLRKCNENGILTNMTLKEVSDLVDQLGSDKINGKIKDPVAFNNASNILMKMYSDPKYAEERNELIKQFNDRLKVNKEKVQESLKETSKELDTPEYEEIKD